MKRSCERSQRRAAASTSARRLLTRLRWRSTMPCSSAISSRPISTPRAPASTRSRSRSLARSIWSTRSRRQVPRCPTPTSCPKPGQTQGQPLPQRSNVLITAGFQMPGFDGKVRAFRAYKPERDSTKPAGWRFVQDGTKLWPDLDGRPGLAGYGTDDQLSRCAVHGTQHLHLHSKRLGGRSDGELRRQPGVAARGASGRRRSQRADPVHSNAADRRGDRIDAGAHGPAVTRPAAR